jgi:hypothetical protein
VTNAVNTARLVRVTATVPEICMHNVKLGPGCFCPHCPTASIDDLRGESEPGDKPPTCGRLNGICRSQLACATEGECLHMRDTKAEPDSKVRKISVFHCDFGCDVPSHKPGCPFYKGGLNGN